MITTSGTASPGGIAIVALGALLLSGCVRYTRAEGPTTGRFAPLHQRDLSAFEHRIAVENHLHTDGPWTRVAEAWLDFANCRPVRAEEILPPRTASDEGADRGDSSGSGATSADRPRRNPTARRKPYDAATGSKTAKFIHATLVLEDVRRRTRTAVRAGGRRLPPGRPLWGAMMRSDYFDREPAELAEDTIRWPAEREDWADEIPAPVRVEGACERMRSRLRPRSRRRGAEPSSPESEGLRARTVAGWRARLLGAIERTLRRFRALPKSRRPGALRHAHQRIRMYGAEAAFRFAQIYRYRPPAARRLPANAVARLDPDRLWRRVGRYVEPLVEGSPPEGLPERKRAHARLLAALYHRRAKRDERALRHVEAALDLGVGDRNLWPARYVRLQLLTRRRAWQQAAEMADDLPPRNSRYFAPYAYRAALAVRRVDQDDRFLGIAKAAFRDRQPEAGPFERALYTDVLRTLVSYEFGPRTIELLEELGPRSRIDRRIEQYARTAIDEGRPEQAADAARWLLRERDDARLEPRYRGILAMAAFLRDEPEQFRTYISEITRRPEALREAIPRERRAAFFAHSDAELARILRRILPMMAGWGRTPAGRERREKWLEIVVEEIQQFLRNTESSLARDRLTKLYRLASSLLADHPRGYAERVGSASSTPLVLGTVRVTKPNLAEHEPLVWATFPVPDTLTPIPRDDAPPSKWAFRWNPDDDGEDDDE